MSETKINITEYWDNRYKLGGNSGAGSYGEESIFKSFHINNIIEEFKLKTITEIGCGDGNQLGLLTIADYYGYDISPTIIDKCKSTFKNDSSKSFDVINIDDYSGVRSSDMIISLDVIFHLVNENSFDKYMKELFSGKYPFVLIYSMRHISENLSDKAPHVKANNVREWIKNNINSDVSLLNETIYKNKEMLLLKHK